MEFLKKKKTYIIASNMVLIGLIKLLTGDMTLVEFAASNDLNIVLEGLGLAALRAGVSNG
jgi:hypothetical protein